MTDDLEGLRFAQLSNENLNGVYKMCESNVAFVSQSYKTFEQGTIGSKYFNPELSIVASDNSGSILAFFMCVLRRPFFASVIKNTKRNVAVLKFFVVEKEWRYKGLGSKILEMIEDCIKSLDRKSFHMKMDAMVSVPDYWFPGLDPRHTEAFFFLEKHNFKKGTERINLCVDLANFSNEEPPNEINGYKISRAFINDREEVAPLKFMPKGYRLGFWPEEIVLSFKNDPTTTFIAKDPQTGKIIGWASHSVGFPGTFGPTGVKSSLQGRGIGGLLLKWCLWDMKRMGLKKCVIRWVTGDTPYFYLKSNGAHISEFFWTMRKII